jgi:glycosyltransferase involved in cell wall biosynthesis
MRLSGGTEQLRVLRVIARMNVGGTAREVGALVRHLDPARFDQRLLVGRVGPHEAEAPCLASLPHERVRGLGRDPSPLDDLRALRALVWWIKSYRPHIVHTHTAKAGTLGRVATLLALPGALDVRPARIHTFHGHLLQGYFSPATTRLVLGAERKLAHVTDRLIAVGRSVRDDLLAAGVGRPDRWAVVPPGIEPFPEISQIEARNSLNLPPDIPIVAFIARLIAVKRPDRMVAVAAKVLRANPEAIFLVAGGGEGTQDLLAAASDAGIISRLRMLGWVEDIADVYGAADLVLLTSDNEGAPLALIEASHAGRPSVTTAVGAAAEVICHGETGLVIPPGDVDALAEAVCVLLDDDERRRRMGRAARRRAREAFSIQRLTADVERIYGEIAQERGWWP